MKNNDLNEDVPNNLEELEEKVNEKEKETFKKSKSNANLSDHLFIPTPKPEKIFFTLPDITNRLSTAQMESNSTNVQENDYDSCFQEFYQSIYYYFFTFFFNLSFFKR